MWYWTGSRRERLQTPCSYSSLHRRYRQSTHLLSPFPAEASARPSTAVHAPGYADSLTAHRAMTYWRCCVPYITNEHRTDTYIGATHPRPRVLPSLLWCIG